MAVTVGTPTTFNRTAGAYPWSDSFNCVIDTGATAALIFISNASALSITPTVTIGGASATLVGTAVSAGGQGTVWVFGILAPTVGATVAVAIGNASNYADIGADGIVPLLGTATSGAFEAFAVSCTSGASQTDSVTTLTAGDLIVSGGFSHYNPATPTCSGTNTVTTLYTASQTNHIQMGFKMSATSAGSYSETFSTTFNPTGFAVVAVKASGGGGGATAAVQLLSMLGCGN